MNTECRVGGEGHIEILGNIETTATEIKSLADGLELLAENIDDHFSPKEDDDSKSNGLLALLFSSIESIRSLSDEIEEKSHMMAQVFRKNLEKKVEG